MADTFNHKLYDVELIVEGNYQEAEPRTHDYPGDAHSFEITKVYAEGDIRELLDYCGKDTLLEQLEKEILEKHYS